MQFISTETDNNAATKWFLIAENQKKKMWKTRPLHQLLCQKIQGKSTKCTYRYGPHKSHQSCRNWWSKQHGIWPTYHHISKLGQSSMNRSVNQRSAHLYITFSNAEATSRAITNGLTICNKKCQVEKARKSPPDAWNAKDGITSQKTAKKQMIHAVTVWVNTDPSNVHLQ